MSKKTVPNEFFLADNEVERKYFQKKSGKVKKVKKKIVSLHFRNGRE